MTQGEEGQLRARYLGDTLAFEYVCLSEVELLSLSGPDAPGSRLVPVGPLPAFVNPPHEFSCGADCLFVPLQGPAWRPQAVEGEEECSTQV